MYWHEVSWSRSAADQPGPLSQESLPCHVIMSRTIVLYGEFFVHYFFIFLRITACLSREPIDVLLIHCFWEPQWWFCSSVRDLTFCFRVLLKLPRLVSGSDVIEQLLISLRGTAYPYSFSSSVTLDQTFVPPSKTFKIIWRIVSRLKCS